MRDDPSTIPPDAQKTPLDGTDFSSLRGARRPTVIVVGGAGAKPIGAKPNDKSGDKSGDKKRDSASTGSSGSGNASSSRGDEEKPTRADDDWSDATVNADVLVPKPSGVVTSSPKVVPLPSKKK